VHFTPFHPDFRLRDRGPTPQATLAAAHAVARRAGLKYAYIVNANDLARQSTYCPRCGQVVIERNASVAALEPAVPRCDGRNADDAPLIAADERARPTLPLYLQFRPRLVE
jgi:hypothetical protein